jgi:hypothetical protein
MVLGRLCGEVRKSGVARTLEKGFVRGDGVFDLENGTYFGATPDFGRKISAKRGANGAGSLATASGDK